MLRLSPQVLKARDVDVNNGERGVWLDKLYKRHGKDSNHYDPRLCVTRACTLLTPSRP